jgi:hypothetical protein
VFPIQALKHTIEDCQRTMANTMYTKSQREEQSVIVDLKNSICNKLAVLTSHLYEAIAINKFSHRASDVSSVH